MTEPKSESTKTRNISTEPPCKKKSSEKKKQMSCYKLFRKVTSGDMMVDDATIELISKCDLGDYEYVMGKNMG